ncbi:MAG: hypothetical protein ACREJS_13255 [Candidatus Rokuibacteriota bacterium]
MPRWKEPPPVAKATLQLTTTARQYGDSDLGVFRLEVPSVDVPATPKLGVAAAYPGDVGIEKDPAVVMATGFESASWLRDWGDSSPGGSFGVVAKDPARRFEPLAGRVARRDSRGKEPRTVWIDGVLVFEKKDIRVRNVPAVKIDRVWMNVYHGGTAPTPRSMHLYIDNVVIARKYIGPLSGGPR